MKYHLARNFIVISVSNQRRNEKVFMRENQYETETSLNLVFMLKENTCLVYLQRLATKPPPGF